tara:strand:+ start:445 stop:1014 length:570 start_codon:yes stop_codon:yes gene_type:complete
MKSEYKKIFKKSQILKFLLVAPFLFSIPLLHNVKVNAGLEFQWDQDSGYRRLKWLQKRNEKRARNTIFFFFRPSDRKADLIKLTMTIPKTFKSTLTEEKISLCQVKIGGFETRTRCIEDIPADIELNEDKTSLEIFPYSPIPSNRDSYAIVFKVFNPKRSGLYQFHSYGQYFGKNPISSYIGSATIVID